MKKIAAIIACLYSLSAMAQEPNELVKEGNDLYKLQQYEQAEAAYSKAIDVATGSLSVTARFNRANTLFKLNRKEEAAKIYNELVNDPNSTTDQKARSYYNKGVLLSEQQQLEASIEAYKNTLRLTPNDQEARENLQKALLELKKKNPPKQQDQQKKQQQQQQQEQKPQESKLSQKEAQRQLDLLRQKEKQVQQRSQQEKSKNGGGQQKDW